jgi:hypothetical protein
MSNADRLAEIVKEAPHSYQVIRSKGGLKLTDAEFSSLISANPDRFKSVQFAKKDSHGVPMLPGRPGVKLVAV